MLQPLSPAAIDLVTSAARFAGRSEHI